MQNDNFDTAIDRMASPARPNKGPARFQKPANNGRNRPNSSNRRNGSRNGNHNGDRNGASNNINNDRPRFDRQRMRPQMPSQALFKNQDVFLSVIVPAYNEEARLPQTLGILDNYLKKQPYTYEIIAVNDGSKDGTGRAVEALIGKIGKLKLLDNHVNHGKGYVVRQGLLAAKGQVRLFTDSDNSTPIEEVEKLLPLFKEGYDVVIGSRHAAGAKLEPAQPPVRQFLGWGWRMLTNVVVGTWAIKDTQCGFKALSAKAAAEILPKCRIDRFAFDPEILILAKAKGFKIKEVGITWKNDTRSTVKVNSMVKMFKDLLRIRANQIKGLYR